MPAAAKFGSQARMKCHRGVGLDQLELVVALRALGLLSFTTDERR